MFSEIRNEKNFLTFLAGNDMINLVNHTYCWEQVPKEESLAEKKSR